MILNNSFFQQPHEIIFRSLSGSLKMISGNFYSARGKKIDKLIELQEKIKHSENEKDLKSLINEINRDLYQEISSNNSNSQAKRIGESLFKNVIEIVKHKKEKFDKDFFNNKDVLEFISFKDIDVAKNISRIHIELEDYESANSFIDALKNKNFAEYSLLKVMLFIKQKKIFYHCG